MAKTTLRILAVAATGLAMLTVAACGEDSSQRGQASTSMHGGPTEALARILEREAPRPAFYKGGFRSGRDVTRSFVEDYDVATEKSGGWLDVDPVLCAQNIPMSIDYRTPRIAGGSATVVAVMTMSPGFKSRKTYTLERSRARWRVAASSCLTEMARWKRRYGRARVIDGLRYLECRPIRDAASVHKRGIACVRAHSVVLTFLTTRKLPRGWEARNPAGCEWILGTRAAISGHERDRVPEGQPVILIVRSRGCRS